MSTSKADRPSFSRDGRTLRCLAALSCVLTLAAASPGDSVLVRFKQVEQIAITRNRNAFASPQSRTYPDFSRTGFARRMADARQIKTALAAIDRAALPHDYQVTYDVIAWDADRELDLAPFRALLFPYTPYEFNFRGPNRVLARFAFNGDADADAYLSLAAAYPQALASMAEHVRDQKAAGIYLQRDAAARVGAIIAALATDPADSFAWPDDARLATLSALARTRLRALLRPLITDRINPALSLFAKQFGPAYQAKAPAAYGLAQYPGGKAYYRVLVRQQLTLDETPEQLFADSQAALDRVESDLQELRAEMGYFGPRADFDQQIRRKAQFVARTPADVERKYLDDMKRIEPFLKTLFCREAPFGYGVARASPAQETALTYGYSGIETAPERRGVYFYNGSDLANRPLLVSQALIYHELAPGHYWQSAMTAISKSLTAYPRDNMAFGEAWGDFSQTLAYEQGVFRTPEERYGRRVFNAMFHARALADIGINYFGYSFDWGLAMLNRYTFEGDALNRRSLVRDTTDWQAQILPYSFGSQAILRLRERARGALGARFSEPRFYDALLSTGGAAFPVLDRHIDWFIAQEKAGGAPGICR